MLDFNVAKSTIVTPISCGDPDLLDNLYTLYPNYVKLACASLQCSGSDKLKYLFVQEKLISAAQMFVSHKVDVSTRSSQSTGSDKFTSSSGRESHSHRESQATRCAWSKASSYQMFQNDRNATDKSDAESNSSSHGEFFENMDDTSTRGACGWTRETSKSESKTAGLGESEASSSSFRRSRSGGGTGPLAGGGLPTPPLPIPSIGAFPPSITFPNPAPIAGRNDPDCGGIDDDGNVTPCVPQSNSGRSYNAKVDITVGLVIPGALVGSTEAVSVSLKFGYGYGTSEKTTHVCSFGTTCIRGATKSKSTFAQDTDAKSEAESLIEDYSSEAHDVHRYGETHRNSNSKHDSLATGVMDSHSERHTRSDSSGHGQGQSTMVGSGWNKSSSKSDGEGSSQATFNSSAMYWDNISNALNELWKSVWKEKEQLRVLIANSISPHVEQFGESMNTNCLTGQFMRQTTSCGPLPGPCCSLNKHGVRI